jgi:hypothetical protein
MATPIVMLLAISTSTGGLRNADGFIVRTVVTFGMF